MKIIVHIAPDGTYTATLKDRGLPVHTTHHAATPEQARQLAIDWLNT